MIVLKRKRISNNMAKLWSNIVAHPVHFLKAVVNNAVFLRVPFCHLITDLRPPKCPKIK